MIGPNLSEWALAHRSFVVFIALLAAVAGAFSYFRLGRGEDPDFTIKTMVVQANWPGASIADTIDQITDRLEKKLQETPSLDNLRSMTTPGQAIIYVTLKDDTAAPSVPEIWYQVRKKIGDIRQTLPSGTLGPFFNDEFGDTFGIVYGFTADPGFTRRELRDWVERARDGVLNLPDVGKVQLIGTQDEKVYIEFSTRRLASLGLDAGSVIATIQNQNAVAPSGVITGQADRTLLEVSGAFRSQDDIRDINIATRSGFIRLGDIATVTRRAVDPPQPMFRVNGREAIGLAVSMTSGGDVLALGRAIDGTMGRFARQLPLGIEVAQVATQPAVVQKAVSGFVQALVEAVVIVLGVSFLTLGFRAGLVVFVSIPLVLALTFLAMELKGIALQRVSLGALIIGLGLLVDDAMITVEMMVAKLEEGMDRAKAAAYAYTSTAFPMLTGTLVTVAAFIPVGFARSASGEYANSMFWVIAFALLLSWIVAVLISPIVGVAVMPETLARAEHGEGRAMRLFRRTLNICLQARWPMLIGVLGLFALSVAGTTLLRQQFFPPSDRPELILDLTMPDRSSIEATSDIVGRIEPLIAKDPDVGSWSFYVGQGAIRFYLPMDIQAPADYRAQAVVVAKDLDARDRLRARLQAALDRDFPDATARIAPLELGPPVGWPVQFRVSGPDPETLLGIALEVSNAVAAVPGTRDIHLDWNLPIRKLRIAVDQDRARLVGLDSARLAQTLQAVTSGIAITQLRDATYLVDVVARSVPAERGDIDTIRTLQIPVGDGRTVPLVSIATIDYAVDQPVVWRRDRQATATVLADVAGATPDEVVRAARPKIDAVLARHPGIAVEVGGTVEQSGKGFGSVLAVVPVMLVVILIVLMVDLQSIQRLVIVLSVAPLGLIGVVVAMLAADKPMGFIAVLGVIALIGMITRNSVILIGQIEQHRRAGEDQWHAVIDATIARTRPIMLTSAAAILGMIPIAREVFWAPLAFAIIGGLSIATVLTLIFLPALYVVWFRIKPPQEPAAA